MFTSTPVSGYIKPMLFFNSLFWVSKGPKFSPCGFFKCMEKMTVFFSFSFTSCVSLVEETHTLCDAAVGKERKGVSKAWKTRYKEVDTFFFLFFSPLF